MAFHNAKSFVCECDRQIPAKRNDLALAKENCFFEFLFIYQASSTFQSFAEKFNVGWEKMYEKQNDARKHSMVQKGSLSLNSFLTL